MRLHLREWHDGDGEALVCVHGLDQHGGVFADLATRLGPGRRIVAPDLRGHGESGHLPPWRIDTLVDDLWETLTAAGIDRAAWIGHSLGGLLAIAAAAAAPERVTRLVLLDPGLAVDPAFALACAENDRLDWSFASAEEAVDAMLAAPFLVATPRETLLDYARDDLRPGPDGRLRFRFCPSASVALWGELTLPPPVPPPLPTLLVRVEVPLLDNAAGDAHLRATLGDRLTEVTVPNGHNLLWEAPAQTAGAITAFLPQAAAA